MLQAARALPIAEQRVGLGSHGDAHDSTAIEWRSIAHYARADRNLGDTGLLQRRDRAALKHPAAAGPDDGAHAHRAGSQVVCKMLFAQPGCRWQSATRSSRSDNC